MKEKIKFILKALKGEENVYTQGSVRAALAALAIPMILEMVMEALFAVVDVFFVSRISVEAVATVGFTESVLMILESIGIGIAAAATAMISRRIGAGNIKDVPRAGANAIILAVFLSVFIGALCFHYSSDILRMIGGDEKLIAEGEGYTKIILGFNIVLVMLFVLNGIFRGAGNASIAMRALWIANGVNIILDPLLIFGFAFIPAMGIEGAAIATCIGRGIGVSYQCYMLYKGKNGVRILPNDLKLHWETIKKVFRISLGGAGQFLITSASWIFLVRIIGNFGSDAVAGYTIGIRIIIFTILPSWGLSNAVATLVGQNLGAGKPERAEKTVWMAGRYNMFFMLGLSIFFFAFAREIVLLFIQDPVVVANGVITLKIIFVGYVFFAYEMVISQAFNGAGDTRTPAMLNFFCLWIIQIPLAYFLAMEMEYGPGGVYWAITISSSILALMAVFIFKKGRWKKVKV